eukprot:364209-Chlamydomonas_euryale.AAC.6
MPWGALAYAVGALAYAVGELAYTVGALAYAVGRTGVCRGVHWFRLTSLDVACSSRNAGAGSAATRPAHHFGTPLPPRGTPPPVQLPWPGPALPAVSVHGESTCKLGKRRPCMLAAQERMLKVARAHAENGKSAC